MKKSVARLAAKGAMVVPFLTWASLALAQTTTDMTSTTTTGGGTGGVTTTTTPGTPNTGVGGDVATMLLLLGVSAVIAVIGAVYLARQSRIGG
jgi:hypothetical protein